MGPCDVLQDLCPWTLRRHPLSQPVSKFPPSWSETDLAQLHLTCFTYRRQGKQAQKRRNLCGQSHLSYRHFDPLQWRRLCDGTDKTTATFYWKFSCFTSETTLELKCVCKVGQVHGGLMGIIQRAMVRSCPHVWFERAEMKDRHLVTKRWDFLSFFAGLLAVAQLLWRVDVFQADM